MDKKKIILIGLGVAILALLFMLLGTMRAKQSVEQERDMLIQENKSQVEKINQLNQETQVFKKRNSELTQNLEQVAKESAELRKKYDFAEKARAGLLDEIKALKSQKEQVEKVITTEAAPSGLQADDAYWARILKAKTDVEFQLEGVRSELKTIQINNEQLLREKTMLDLEVGNLKRESSDLRRQFEYNQKLMDSISQELVREKNDKREIQDSYQQFKSENLVLRKQLSSLNNRKIALERKLNELQDRNNVLQSKLNEAEALAKAGGVSRGGYYQESTSKPQAQEPQESAVELPPIVVRPPKFADQVVSAPAAFEGKVLAVNRENNFVIIDQGEEEGIKLGDTFKAERNGKVIGSLEVIQVRKAISACDIKRETTPIKVGDNVR